MESSLQRSVCGTHGYAGNPCQVCSLKAISERYTSADLTASKSDEELWNEPVGPYVSADANLRQSAPDLAFAVQTENQGFATDRVELMTPLSQLFLDLIKEEKQLHPYPTSSNPNYAFPFLVYEAKSDSQPLFYAENQAANGVVKALKMLRGLETEYVNVGGVIDRPLPVIAICSQGSSWEVMIAYFAPSNGTFRRFVSVHGTFGVAFHTLILAIGYGSNMGGQHCILLCNVPAPHHRLTDPTLV